MIQVYVSNEQEVIPVDAALLSLIERVVTTAWEIENRQRGDLPANAEVSVMLVDDASIHSLNLQYRNVDRATDVLSFAMMEGEDFPELEDIDAVPLGDIVISLERAREQAEEYGHSFEREVAFLAVHGMCHLLGYDHQTESDRIQMREKEESVLMRLNLTRD